MFNRDFTARVVVPVNWSMYGAVTTMRIPVASGNTITALLAAAISTTNPSVNVESSSSLGRANQITQLNGTTPVTVFTGTDGTFQTGNQTVIESISVNNNDTAPITLILRHIQSGTTFQIARVTLAVGDTFVCDASGMFVLDANGNRKNINATFVTSLTAGNSTAAAGSTNADATALPAGTGSVYPTTAADGTKGVIVNAADQVSGRMLFIGNGVSNQILKVYPPAGGTINGAAANAAFSSASGKGVIMYCLSASANTWLAW